MHIDKPHAQLTSAGNARVIRLNRNSSPNDIWWVQRRALPAFRALIRAMETRLFLATGPLPRPMLDVGCGDGHFAQVIFDDIDTGIDLNLTSLDRAAKCGVYHKLYQASATALPFPDGVFASVVSNCTIEHVPNMPAALAEFHRVLRPGGMFIFSVPTDKLNEKLGISQALSRVGAAGLAERYKTWFTHKQVHFHMYSPDEWQRYVERVGFRVKQRTGYMSARATVLFDLAHFYGVPDLFTHQLTGRWVAWPWRPRFAVEEAIFSPLVAEDNPPDATCCFFAVIKE
jgi:ubiquinone/menaquinone biosynthesis C-methylase UbiE